MGQNDTASGEQLCALKGGRAPSFLHGLFGQLLNVGVIDPISRIAYVPDGLHPAAWVICSLLRTSGCWGKPPPIPRGA